MRHLRTIGFLSVVILASLGITHAVTRPFIKPRVESWVAELNSYDMAIFRAAIDSELAHGGVQNLPRFYGIGEKIGSQFDWWLVDKDGRVWSQGQSAKLPDKIRREISLWSGVTPKVIPDSPELTNFSSWTLGKLKQNSSWTLVVHQARGFGAASWPIRLVFLTATAFWCLMSIAVSFFLAGWYLRSRGKQAENLFKKIKAGDLQTRFEIRPHDSASKLLVEFNHMADEIERLVAALKKTERTRVELIEELGHDLRTPIMSIHTVLETLQMYESNLSSIERQSSLGLAMGELKYLTNLLEDLFFIARMNTPGYPLQIKSIDLVQILESELKQMELSRPHQIKAIITKEGADLSVDADEQLVRRLVRNLVMNARRYAKSKININVFRAPGGECQIIFQDDGTGFTQEGINNYGKRAHSRKIKDLANGEGSTGLGSVICTSIMEIHGGKLEVSNWTSPETGASGAQISVSFQKPIRLHLAA